MPESSQPESSQSVTNVNMALTAEQIKLLDEAMELQRADRVEQRLTRTSFARLLVIESCKATVAKATRRQKA